jgi:hypothetical protein
MSRFVVQGGASISLASTMGYDCGAVLRRRIRRRKAFETASPPD